MIMINQPTFFLLSCAWGVSYFSRNPETAFGATTTQWTPFQCRSGILGPNDDRMKEVAACGTGDCVYYCQASALGLLNGEGVPTIELYDVWTTKVMPERHHKYAIEFFRDCWEKYGKNIDKKDETCHCARLYGDCTWKVVANLTC